MARWLAFAIGLGIVGCALSPGIDVPSINDNGGLGGSSSSAGGSPAGIGGVAGGGASSGGAPSGGASCHDAPPGGANPAGTCTIGLGGRGGMAGAMNKGHSASGATDAGSGEP